jgi:membrane glycosyltransferase
MSCRRLSYAVLFAATVAGMFCLATVALTAGGFGVVDVTILSLFALALPWMVIGFWNAIIGLVIMRCGDPAAALIPAAATVRGDEVITASTAILLCIRNESPGIMFRNLEAMILGLTTAGYAARFHLYVLSDTSEGQVATREEARFGVFASRWRDRIAVTYRRRGDNAGYKAGNIRDFCERWGVEHEFALILDADSFMSAGAILGLVRIMQADAGLGILQSLVVGLPSTSAFARMFQFGMRLLMRSNTVGSAWWQGDCGPYWGHNALIRLAPFIAHCRLPELSGRSGERVHILSHAQIEAALMRGAGFGVRVVPVEDSSWEENPPTLIELVRRDLRWCQGNMQYWRFLTLPGVPFVNRCNLAIAISMFIGSPAWVGMFLLGTLSVAFTNAKGPFLKSGYGTTAFALILIMWLAPMTVSAIDILLRPNSRRDFGGTARFLANLLIAYVFSILLYPIMWLSHTIFMVEWLFGRRIGWMGQFRDVHAVPPRLALRGFWPHTLLGCGALGLLAAIEPTALPCAVFLGCGPALAIPFAIATAWPKAGVWSARVGLGRLPEETCPPPEIRALGLDAIKIVDSMPEPQVA